MAARKPSPHTRYRHSRARLGELEMLRAALERTRPRKRGKKAAKTRALNKLARQIPAAKGLLTKARNAIAKAARTRNAGTTVAKRNRSEAAKKGWATRRACTTAAPIVDPEGTVERKLGIPFLTVEKGVVGVWPPSKDDRKKVGKYWSTVDRLLSNQPASFESFEGDSIFDEISGKRLPFVTDLDVIYAHNEEYLDFGISFYRDRREYARLA